MIITLFLSYYMLLISSILTFFFFNDTATTEIYTLSLHDALPISPKGKMENQKKAEEEIKSPAVLKLRAPYLSERNPLSGPNITKAIEKGIRRRPAVRASSPKAPWK